MEIRKKHQLLVTRFNWLKEKAASALMDQDHSGSLNFYKVVKLSKGAQTLPFQLNQEGVSFEGIRKRSALMNNFSANFDTNTKFTMNNLLVSKIFYQYHLEEKPMWKKFTLEVSYEEVANAILRLKEKKPGYNVYPIHFFKEELCLFYIPSYGYFQHDFNKWNITKRLEGVTSYTNL